MRRHGKGALEGREQGMREQKAEDDGGREKEAR